MRKPSTWDGRMTGVRAFGLAAAVFGLVAVFAAPASAASVKCKADLTASISPGITATPTGQTLLAGGDVDCVGAAQGTGLVTLTGSSTGDTCLGGAGSATFATTLLAPKNVGQLSGTISFVRYGTTLEVTGGVVTVTGEQKSETLTTVSGYLFFIPTPPQNCFWIPITSADVYAEVKART